jgi:phosphatidate cytidylyltransferase
VRSRAGRPLVAATVVALVLLAILAASLLLRTEIFVGVLGLGIALAVLELQRALAGAGIALPLPPLLVMAVGLPAAAYAAGPEALLALTAVSVPVLLVWRLADDDPRRGRDAAIAVLVALWVPFLGSFLALLADADDGAARVLTAVLVTTASDTGGYLVGVLIGRHPLAPRVSPAKSWEGFIGSVVLAAAVGTASAVWLLGIDAWIGLLLGAAVAITSTAGDLTESMVKRSIGVKDMSHLLPGHGGLLDRVDGLLFTAPLVWWVLSLVVGSGT